MKLKTNSNQVSKTKCTSGGLFSLGMEQLSIGVVEWNDGPAAPGCVVDIELVPSMSDLVPLRRQLSGAVLCGAPTFEPRRACKPMGNQIVTHGQLGPEVLNGVIADCESLAIRNVDALQGNPEQLPFNVAPLSNGGTKLMFEGDDFLSNVHGARTKPPND